MKVLILAAGRGKRLLQDGSAYNKCMSPINGRPVLEYSLDCAVKTGIDEMIIVVGYRAEDIINRYGTFYDGRRIKYVVQQEQKGLVHALECSRRLLDGEDFLLMLGDEVMINPRHRALVEEFNNTQAFAVCGVLPVEQTDSIKRTYCIVEDGGKNIFRMIEKPRRPLNNLMGTGACAFNNKILDYIEYTPIHHQRGEKELPDLIQCAIDDGNVVKSFVICDRYTNINTHDDIGVAESFFQGAEISI